MPLLGKKVFALAAQAPNNDQSDAPYMIPHTKERFRSKVEYEKRVDLYSQLIWTCRATGHTSLSHEEACKSEKVVTEQLNTQFPKCFEKDVLSQVHHSVQSLDSLVDQAWLKLHTQYVVGEKVSLKVKVADKSIPAKISAVDTTVLNGKNGNECNSPSSDKENSSDEAKSPKKWTPPKFLPFTYSIELEKEAKIIHSVPGNDLQREEKAPAKDLLRLFIRVSAIRSGNLPTSPWVVNDNLVKEHKLVGKFADFFLSPLKMADAFKKAEGSGKKRKSSNEKGSASKKLKLDKSLDKKKKKKDKLKSSENKKASEKNSLSGNKKKSDQSKVSKSPGKKESPSKKTNGTSSGKKENDVVVLSDSDSEDNVSLAKLKKGSGFDSDDDTALYRLANETTPKKKKKSKEDADELPLSKIAKKPSSKNNTPLKKTPSKVEKAEKKKEKTPTKKDKKLKPSKEKSKKDTSKNKNGLKQATLFEVTKKGKQQNGDFSTPKKKPSKPKAPPTPAVVRRLLVAKRETNNDKVKYALLLKKVVETLTPIQAKKLPPELKEQYDKKKSILDEKKKLDKMSAEEKEAYLKAKKQEQKKIQKQRMLERQRDQNKRFEDNDLDLTPLPSPRLVSTPDGFPNELFGDVSMVTEFINCYSGLLMPDDEYPIYTDALMKALVGGPMGYTYLSRVLTVLLQTLLQDQMSEDYKTFETKLSDVAVSPYTSSELVRLCLSNEDDEEEEEDDVPEEYIKCLMESEFFELDLEAKLCLLKALCSRVMETYSAQDYMETQQKKASALWKQKNVQLKELAAQKKSEKGNTESPQVEGKDKKVEGGETPKGDNKGGETPKGDNKEKDSKNGVTITAFYGKQVVDKPAEDSGDEGKDWATLLKQRRVNSAKAAAEKEQQERELKKLREKEYEEEKKREKERRQQVEMDEAINLARMVLRQDPIGTDRNHDRYWVFTNTTPGLYVEKGWVGDNINYSVAKRRSSKNEFDSSDDEMDTSGIANQTGTTPLKEKYKMKKHIIETSLPHVGQNLWFIYKSPKDLDGLLNSLHPQGIRESLLKTEVKKRYDELERAINKAQRMNMELRDCDGEVEMKAGFRRELCDMELRLRNGGLGGVPDFAVWEARVESAEDMTTLGQCLLEVKEGILEKFLQGFMKPKAKANESEVKEVEEESEEEEVENEAHAGVTKSAQEVASKVILSLSLTSKEDGEEKPKEKEDKNQRAVREWREGVEQCQSMSRLHVLMAVLETCVKWEKSAENAKCKICRKKTDDEQLLLCDECNCAFHMYCLRPSLYKLPSGDWFCTACKPKRSESRRSDSRRSMQYSESESEEEEKEEACRECGGTDQLIICSKCPAAFHTQCHDPPLRHAPRGKWECQDCVSGVSSRKKKGKYARKVAPKTKYQEASSSEDEEEEEQKPSRSRGRGRPSQKATKKRKQVNSSSEEEEDSEEEEEEQKPSRSRGRGRPSQKATKKRKQVASSSEEDEEEDSEEEEEEESEEEQIPSGSRSRGRSSKTESAKPKTPPSGRSSQKRTSRGKQREVEESITPQSRTNRRGPSEMTLCEEVLAKVMKHKSSWPFLDPVDRKEVPDYHLLIKKPMDFMTMQRKCTRLSYASPQEFIEDAALVFENAESYNESGSEVFECMREVEKVFKDLLKKTLPDWPYYRTVGEKEEGSSGSESGRRRSRNK